MCILVSASEEERKEAARKATKAFAEYCGITYERACDIAMEVFDPMWDI